MIGLVILGIVISVIFGGLLLWLLILIFKEPIRPTDDLILYLI